MKRLTLALLLLFSLQTVLAAHSSEPIYTRVDDVDVATREYTFRCYYPPTLEKPIIWDIREGDTLLFNGPGGDTFTRVLSKDVVYHVGCHGYNGTGQNRVFLNYDHHIDRRIEQSKTQPNIAIVSTDGLQVKATCVAPNATNYHTYWYWNKHNEHYSLTQFNDKSEIATNAPREGLWELACGTFDIDNQVWTQDAVTLEFFSTGAAYVPSADGCVPNEPCPYAWKFNLSNNQTTTPNTTTPGNQSTCAESVQQLPANCTGSITNDVFNGCRSISCTQGTKSIQVLACDKEGYFEMYRQSVTGAMQVCIGTTCISDNGYARSPSFPICTQIPNASQGNSTPPGNVTAPAQNTSNTSAICYSLATLPASCDGQITSDTFNGCRTIVCKGMQVLACDKNEFFEMYKQSGDGARICLGETCIGDNGFAKSGNYPICTGNVTNTTDSTTPLQEDIKVSLAIAPWFPQGRSYVFVCNATSFAPASFDFTFGDGNTNSNRPWNDVYYTYSTAGTYNVTCTASNGSVMRNATIAVSVT